MDLVLFSSFTRDLCMSCMTNQWLTHPCPLLLILPPATTQWSAPDSTNRHDSPEMRRPNSKEYKEFFPCENITYFVWAYWIWILLWERKLYNPCNYLLYQKINKHVISMYSSMESKRNGSTLTYRPVIQPTDDVFKQSGHERREFCGSYQWWKWFFISELS